MTREHLARSTLCPGSSTSHHVSPSPSCLPSCLFLTVWISRCPLHRLSGLLISRALNLACSHVLGFLREKTNQDGRRKTAAVIHFLLSAVCSEPGGCTASCRNARSWGCSRVNLQSLRVNVVPVESGVGNTCADSLSQALYVISTEFCSCQPLAPDLFSHLCSFNFLILTKPHLLSLNLFISVVTIPISSLFLAS